MVEGLTDLVVYTCDGPPLLVSIKHREPSQRGDVGWTWSALKKKGVLKHLYDAWLVAERACPVAFYSNAGLEGPAQALAQGRGPNVVDTLASTLGVETEDARAFLDALTLPEDPLPRRTEIQDVARARIIDFLRRHERTAVAPEVPYEALVRRIERKSRDRSDALGPRVTVAPAPRSEAEVDDRFISADEVVDLLLRVHDGHVAPKMSDRRWQPDPFFQGRTGELDALEHLLNPGSPREVAPVVLSGMSGTGKTSLALQFAALWSSTLEPVLIDGSSRVSLAAALTQLGGAPVAEPSARIRGPVAPLLPGTSAMLLILDQVPDRDVVQGLVPRQGLCRVIITTTVTHLDDGFQELKVRCWEEDDSRKYIHRVLPDVTTADADELAVAVHHHPMAIVQAVNLCRRLDLTVAEYLTQLTTSPLATLDSGVATGHPQTVTAAVKLSLDAASRVRGALEVLGLVGFLGPDAVPERLFDQTPIAVVLSGEDVPEPNGATWLHRSGQISNLVSDVALRRKSALALADLSLLELKDGLLSVHPFTKLVFEAAVGDVRPWMEVALGLFAKYFANLDDARPLDTATDVPMIVRLVDVCLERDVRGPSLYALMIVVAPSVASLLDVRKAVKYGRIGYEWALRAVTGDRVSRLTLMLARRHYAEMSMLADATERAVQLYRAAADDAAALGDRAAFIDLLLDLSVTATITRRRDLIDDCLRQLDAFVKDLDQLSPPEQVSVRLARARLLWHTAHIADAAADVRDALSVMEDIEGWPALRAEAHRMAADHARPTEHETLITHSDGLLAALRQTTDGSLSRSFAYALVSAADHKISANTLHIAEEHLDEAGALARRRYTDDTALAAEILAIRGRLYLHQVLIDYAERRDVAGLARATATLAGAVEALRRQDESRRNLLAGALFNLGQALLYQGDFSGAIRATAGAYDVDLKRYGPHHPETVLDKQALDRIVALRSGAPGIDVVKVRARKRS